MNRNKKTNTKKMIAKASAASLALALTATSVPATALPAFAATKTVSEFGAVSAKEATPKITLRNNATVYVSNKKFSIIKSNTKKLKFTVKSSNPKVAKVNSKGEVMAVKAGKATISVSYNVTVKGKKTKKTVKSVLTVKDPILLNKSAYNVVENDQALVKLISKKYDTKVQVVSATTTSKSVIKLNTRTGNFKALKAGTAKITLTLKVGNGYSKGGTVKYTRTIKVAAAQIEGVTLTKAPEKSTYKKDEALDLKGLAATVKYNNGTTKTISGEDVKVEKGIEQGKYGVQTIEVSYAGFKFSFDVELEAPGVDPTPSTEPSVTPSVEPSAAPSDAAPSVTPSVEPSVAPSVEPSAAPSVEPSTAPSADQPSVAPSVEPSAAPSDAAPSADQPSVAPSTEPSAAPSDAAPSTDQPSVAPSTEPSVAPSTPSEPQQATVTEIKLSFEGNDVFGYKSTEEDVLKALKVQAVYSDGTTTDKIDSKYFKVTFNTERTAGTVTVEYEGKTASIDFTISAAAIESVKVSESEIAVSQNSQTADQLANVLETIKYTLIDEAGNEKDATLADFDVEGDYDVTKTGDYQITLISKENPKATAKVKITVVAVPDKVVVGEVAAVDEGTDKDVVADSIRSLAVYEKTDGTNDDIPAGLVKDIEVTFPEGAVDEEGKLVAGNWEVTVSLAGVKSTTVEVKVKDVTAPSLKSAEFEDYKTVVLTFDEKIKAKEGEAIAVTTKKDGVQLNTASSATIQEDETSIKVTYATELADGSYEFTVSGITDQSENANALTSEKPAVIDKVVKEKSVLKTVKVLSETIPAASLDSDGNPEKKFDGEIKLGAYDQYGKELTINSSLVNDVEIKAYAGTGDKKVAVAIGAGESNRSDSANRAVTDGTIAEKVYFSDADYASLTKGQTVTISVVGKGTDNKGQVYMEGTPFELVEYQAAVATSIDSIQLVNVSDSGDTITAEPGSTNKLVTNKAYKLTVNWKDQYGNALADNATDTTPAKWEITGNSAASADLVKVVETSSDPYYEDGTAVKTVSSANGDKHSSQSDVTLPLKLVPSVKTPADAPLVLQVSRGTSEIQTFNFEISAPALTTIDTTDYDSDSSNKTKFRALGSSTATYNTTAGTDLYTKEELTSYNIAPTVAGAELNPEDLKVVVTAVDNTDATKEIDLTKAENAPKVSIVKAKKLDAQKKETTEEETNKLQVKLTPAVEGSYTVKVYKADSDTEKDQPVLTLTTGAVTKNPTIKDIKLLDTFAENEITSGGKSGFKKVEFINVNDEQIDVASDASGETASTNGLSVINKTGTIKTGSVTFHAEDADGNPVETAAGISTPIKYIRVETNSSDNAGKGQFALQGVGKYGSAFLTVDINVVAAAQIQSVAFTKTESSAQPIIDDITAADPDSATKFKVVNISDDSNNAYTLIPVSFVNQYGGAMDVKSKLDNDDVTLNDVTVKLGENEIKGSKASGAYGVADVGSSHYKAGFFDKDGNAIQAADKDVAYIGIHAESSAAEAGLDLTMTAIDPDGKEVKDTIHVSPQKARALKTITLDKTTATLSPNASIYFKLDAKDQYGKAIDVKTKVNSSSLNIDGVDAKLGNTTIDAVDSSREDGYTVEYYNDENGEPASNAYMIANDDSSIKYIKVTAGSETTAATTLTLTKDGETTPLASASIDFVGTDDIKSIKLVNEVTATTIDGDTGVYKDGTIYAAHTDTDANTYTIPLKAYTTDDATGKTIDVEDAFYKGQDGSTEPTVVVKDKDGQVKSHLDSSTGAVVDKGAVTLTLKGDTDKIAKDDTVEITVTSKNVRSAKLTLKVDTTQPALATDISVVNATNAVLKDESGAYPAVDSDGINANTTYTDTTTQKAVTAPTKLAVQGVDQYGVLRNTIDDKSVIENGTPIYYSDTKAVVNVTADGQLMPMANGTGIVRVIRAGVETAVKVNVSAGLAAAPKNASRDAKVSNNEVTISDLTDTTKQYKLVDATTGAAKDAAGAADSGAKFNFSSGASAGTYYLFETDADHNITSYAATVNVTK